MIAEESHGHPISGKATAALAAPAAGATTSRARAGTRSPSSTRTSTGSSPSSSTSSSFSSSASQPIGGSSVPTAQASRSASPLDKSGGADEGRLLGVIQEGGDKIKEDTRRALERIWSK